ncbi:MAG: hypothetical protein U0234_33290 [Sandaracinus sp.]
MRLEIRTATLVGGLIAASAMGGCARHYPEGVYPCAVDGDCPPHWFCRADALCRSTPERDAGSDAPVADAHTVDAWTPSDTMPPDAATPDVGRDANCMTSPYYADCDGDHFAPPSAERVDECTLPTSPPSACADGHWTVTEPTVGNADCADDNRLAYPRSTTSSATPAWTDSAGRAHFDYNCDGVETQLITDHDLGSVHCEFHDDPPYDDHDSVCWTDRLYPIPPLNWVGAVPACGVVGELNTCPSMIGISMANCRPAVEYVAQPCR